MALGPKAMGEAILANLKAKTGHDLDHWLAVLRRSGLNEPAAARQLLQDAGLGRFQAMSVVEHALGANAYSDAGRLVEAQFKRHPSQRALYDSAIAASGRLGLEPKPCRGYLPLYRAGRIVVSFKSTARGLYAALNLAHPSKWPERVDHKASLGGSARLKDGIYLHDAHALKRLLAELA